MPSASNAPHPFKALFRDEWRGRPYLLSPVLDVFMAGGGALIALLVLMFWIPFHSTERADITKIAYLAAWAYWLSFVVNYPHFLVSYQLLYRNYRQRLRQMHGNPDIWWRTINAGIVAPALLICLLGYAGWMMAENDHSWVGVSLQVLQFTVGWHYTKQAFGVFMVCSALKKTFYTPLQRRVLIVNAYAVWMFSWVYMAYFNGVTQGDTLQGKIGVSGTDFTYPLMQVPDFIRIPMLCFACLTTLAAAYVILAQWRATGKRPSVTALTGYLSMYYLWVFMNYVHPQWVLIAPFFHSMQYLLFVAAYRRGESHEELHVEAMPPRKVRDKAQMFFAFSFLLGALGFVILPTLCDSAVAAFHPGLLPKGLFMLIFAVFINVHHFFIDNVIWRRENPDVSRFLLGWRMQPKAA